MASRPASGGAWGDEEQVVSFVGEKRGEYAQELVYRWVGDGQGDFDVAPPPRGPRRTGCYLCLGSLAVFCALVLADLMSDPGPPELDKAAGAEFDCDSGAFREGDLVQASQAISFRPSGSVAEGAFGRVAAIEAEDPSWVVVNWNGLPKLQGSKVSKRQLVKALRPGDEVQAIAEISASSIRPPPDQLQVDDLVLAVKDLQNGVPEGTAGYITTVLPADGTTPLFRADFPAFPQFPATDIRNDEVVKAPRVADHVTALRDIRVASGTTVRAGSEGVVTGMRPERGTYVFGVDWGGVPGAQPVWVGGLDVKTTSKASAPAPLNIHRGATGTVVSVPTGGGLWKSTLTVAWADESGGAAANANVSRGQVDKVPRWSTEQRQFCCSKHQVGCGRQLLRDVPFACDTKEVWTPDEASWCCASQGLRCEAA